MQLFALAKFVYSLKPPENPNRPKTEEDRTLVTRGEGVFQRLRCARCHSGDQYTNNKLTPVDGFTVPASTGNDTMSWRNPWAPTHAGALHAARYRVLQGPLVEGCLVSGPVRAQRFDRHVGGLVRPATAAEGYEPTGWKGPPGTKTRAVPGHRFGLNLPPDDRKALIAFLKTL